MPVNDFQPFGLGIGANVLPTADWVAASERVMGFERGLGSSIKANTAWRHCSFITAAVAFLVAEDLDEDVLDNGDLPGFIDQLRRTMIEATGGPDVPDDGNTYIRMYRRWVLGDSVYLPLSGGQLSGFLTLHAPPAMAMHAVNKAYVDDAVANLLSYLQGQYLPITGGQMQGFLTLHAQPTQPMHAASKSYIDDAVANMGSYLWGSVIAQLGSYLPLGGGTMQGPIYQPAGPSHPWELSNKDYVDWAAANAVQPIAVRVAALEGAGGGTGTVRAGTVTTDASGFFFVTFTPAFPSGVAWVDVSTFNSLFVGLDGFTTIWVNQWGWYGQAFQDWGGTQPLPNSTINWWAIGW